MDTVDRVEDQRTAVPDSLHVIASDARRGAEIFGDELARRLRARGAKADVVALSRSVNRTRLDVDVVAEEFGFRSLGRLRSKLRSAEVAVAHGSTSLPALALVGGGTPFVYRSIGDPRHWSSAGTRRLRSSLFLGRAAAVVVLWPVIADVLHKTHRIPYERIHVIPNAVSGDEFPLVDDTRRHAARAALGLPSDVPVAVMVGALSGEKGVISAIDAVAAVPDMVLVLAGDGPERAGLEERAAARLPGRTRFLGSVEDPESVVAAADVILLTSRTEGLPGVLIEAGLSGIPVVAHDVGGVREIVVHGRTGVVVPPGKSGAFAEGIQAALADGPQMGLAARERCLARFDMAVVSEQWASLLASL